MYGQPDDYIETNTTGNGFGRGGYKYRVMDRQKLRPTHHTNDIENARRWAKKCIEYWLKQDALSE